jgi:hypothetical protein
MEPMAVPSILRSLVVFGQSLVLLTLMLLAFL